MKIIYLTILFGLLCLAADSAFQDVVITPLLGLCLLMFVAIHKDWIQVIRAFLVMFVFVLISLIGQNPGRIIVRSSSFVLAAGLAVAFSRSRQRSIDALASSRAIIRGTPIPMVAADLTGSIVAASDEITHLLPSDFVPLIGHSFADVFMGNLPPGRAMKLYLDWFHENGMREAKLFLREGAGKEVAARILTTGDGRDRLLVAAIQEPVQRKK